MALHGPPTIDRQGLELEKPSLYQVFSVWLLRWEPHGGNKSLLSLVIIILFRDDSHISPIFCRNIQRIQYVKIVTIARPGDRRGYASIAARQC